MTHEQAQITGAGRQLTPLWSRTWVKIAAGFIVPIVIVIAWQIATVGGFVPPYRLPTPWSVVEAAQE
ncbi:MAG TPA: hypothetical protein VKZ73_01515, partial [Microbacterium sp.]|nr:hypothetical protein [Microbacterium sp.]